MVATSRQHALDRFHWLLFSGTLLILGDVLRSGALFFFYSTPWAEAVGNYAALGAFLALVGGALTLVLALAEALARRIGRPSLAETSFGIAFCVGFPAWLNLLRAVLVTNGLVLAQKAISVQLAAFCLLALVLCWRFGPFTRRLMQVTAENVRPFNVVSLVAYFGFTLYLLLGVAREQRPIPTSMASRAGQMPNVIIIVLDGLSSHDMSLYGYGLPTTPELDRLSGNWTVYENAHSAASGTLASIPVLLTGRYPYLDDWHRYGDLAHSASGWLDLSELVRDAGYEGTFMTGVDKFPSTYHLDLGFSHVVAGIGEPWLPLGVWRRATPYALSFAYGWGLAPASSAGDSESTVAEPIYAYAEQYLYDQAKRGKPFFAYFHMLRPHQYYLGNEQMGTFLPLEDGLADKVSQDAILRASYTAWPTMQEPIGRLRLRYDENIRKADAEMGHLIDTVKRAGLYDQSLIIITADHGECFTGGWLTHYTPLLSAAEHSIPLLIKYPGQTVGRRDPAMASNIDVVPTVLDVLGISYPADWVDGRSLRSPTWGEERTLFARVPDERDYGHGLEIAAVRGKLKLVSRKGELHLFDLAADPDEHVDLLARDGAGDLQQALDRFAERIRYARAGGDIREAPPLLEDLGP